MKAKRSRGGLNVAWLGVGAIVVAACSQPSPRDDQSSASSPRTAADKVALVSPAFARTTRNGQTVTVADVAERAVPSVVNLSATQRVDVAQARSPLMDDPILREFFGQRGMPDLPQEREARSLGSGVIVSADGVVLTSAHVVANADQVEITLHDGTEVDGKVVGADPRSDLAVVRIQEADKDEARNRELVPLPLGDSQAMRLGEVVLAIGNPFGVGQTVTMGIVSATGRSSMGIIDYEDFIQTDAAINPGNSGGALVNMKGELVGINTAILSRTGGSMGIGFAVPSAMASPIMKSLLASGKVTRGFLGVSIQELDRDLAEALQLGADKGVLIADVTASGPAEKAGLARGDLIRSLDGKPVDSASRFRNEIAARAPGTAVKLEVLREGKPRTVEVQLGTLEQEPARMGDRPGAVPRDDQGDDATDGDLLGGLAVTELGPRLRRQLRTPSNMRGVVVTKVQPGGGADRLGLRPGDVLLEVNRRPITSVADFRRAVGEASDRVVVLVFRDGSTAYLTERD